MFIGPWCPYDSYAHHLNIVLALGKKVLLGFSLKLRFAFVIWQLEEHLKKPESSNVKEEKEKMMKLFEWCKTRFAGIMENLEDKS